MLQLRPFFFPSKNHMTPKGTASGAPPSPFTARHAPAPKAATTLAFRATAANRRALPFPGDTMGDFS